MLKEALRRGLVPSWDAANPTSEAISSRMGYELARKYKAYRV